MQEIPQNQASPQKKKFSALNIALVTIVVVIVAIGGWFFLGTPGSKNVPVAQTNLPAGMSLEEAAYVNNLRIENIALSRAENFIHQEVTILNADIVNGGPQALQRVSLTVEFSDDMHQTVLRESRGVLGNPPVILAPGQRRGFQLSFDRVPASWNMRQPSVQVTYLRFAPAK